MTKITAIKKRIEELNKKMTQLSFAASGYNETAMDNLIDQIQSELDAAHRDLAEAEAKVVA